MSLQICPVCNESNSYWRVYKEINFKHFKKGMSIECEHCKSKMEVDIAEQKKPKNLCSGILWIGVPILLVYLAYTGKVSYLMAIIYVTLFHFGAMYYLIKRMNYKNN